MKHEQRPTLMVVIVNYRTGKLVVDCLASLEAEVAAYPGTRVVVVDNDSRDGSADIVEAAIQARGWSSWATLMRSPVNGGFAAGNNFAIRAALADPAAPDLFWLLNPDTRVHPGALGTFLEFFEANPTVGIAGNLLLYGNEMPWPFAFRFPSILSELERGASFGPLTKLLRDHCVAKVMGTAPEQVDSVSGASMVVRRATLYATGLMDEGYFLYYEETDFCRKALQQGWSCWYLPSAVVLHIAGQSTGLKDNQASRIPRYWFDSRRRYFIVNHGKGYAIIADMAWLAGHMWWRLLRRLRSRKDTVVPFLLRDFIARSALFNDAQAQPVRA